MNKACSYIMAVLLLSGLLGAHPALATLSSSKCVSGSGAGNPLTLTFGSAIRIGDAIAVFVGDTDNDTISVSDGTNGTYASVMSYVYTTEGVEWWWVKNSAGNTPTVSIANPNANYLEAAACDITGFIGTPTFDSAISFFFNSSTSTTTVDANEITSGQNSEFLLFGFIAPSSGTNGFSPSGWTYLTGSNVSNLLEVYGAYEPTAGTTNNISGTLTSAQNWYALSIGIYDSQLPGHESFAQWVSQPIGPGMNLTDGQAGGFSGPAVIALGGPEAPFGSIVQIFPITAGRSGTLVINDCATVAEATSANQIFSLDYSEINAGMPININATFRTGLVISSVPAGMTYAVLYDGPGGPGGTVFVHSPP